MKQIITYLLLFFTAINYAQVDSVYTGEKVKQAPKVKTESKIIEYLKNNGTYGGNFIFYYYYGAVLNIAPTVGVKLSKDFNVGTGFNYYYFGYSNSNYSFYGWHNYARIMLTQTLFLQGQYDYMFQPNLDPKINGDRVWVNYAMLGAGYRYRISEKASVLTTFLYNFTPSINSQLIAPLNFYFNTTFIIGL
ncbi:MAG: hypothetical protein JSU07_05675 [Bacteroidetes bacterium]|nr:hypothetical protein [Bacteroidota bacterium]